MDKKIKTRGEIAAIASELHGQGKRIVTCNGSFDVMHIGHIKFLQEAKAQGDVLIAGLNSDSSIKKYKSKDRPINSEDCRAEFLAALACVDYVTIFSETDPRALLEEVKPDVHVNGIEYSKNSIEAETVKKNGGRMHHVKLYRGYSTTNLIKKILEIYCAKENPENKKH